MRNKFIYCSPNSQQNKIPHHWTSAHAMNNFYNCEQQEREFQVTVSPSYMSYEAALVVEKEIEQSNFYANRFQLQLASEQ